VDFELIPHVGAGALRFGMSRSDVRSTLHRLGFPLSHENETLDYFCENSIRTEYTDGSLSFIEFSCDERFRPLYRGTDVFSLTAQELFAAIAEGESGGPHAYDPLEYVFPEQIIAVWEADSQYDHRTHQTRVVWGAVGVGDARYLAAVMALANDV
jgi:hypothetical protein